MSVIDLDRRFVEWLGKSESGPDVVARFGLSGQGLSWADLRKRRRVVLLAEAGSGKTKELERQADELRSQGSFAFYIPVQDVGAEGLRNALFASDRPRFDAWRESDKPAWFYLDSVDEAKLAGVHFRTALRKIAEGISGAEGRAHIILSARYTDWEYGADLERLKAALPLPDTQHSESAPTLEQLIVHIIRHQYEPNTVEEPEAPLIVVMASLDRDRVRRFAVAQGADYVDEFLTQIDVANLWRFARRPLDLGWLVEFWQSHRRLGALREMLRESLAQRLSESNPDRARTDRLDAAKARAGLERVGAALVFGQADTIAVPDSESVPSQIAGSLKLGDILPDWSAQECQGFLGRAVFDPATFGRARLHNDNEGVVRAYLAACWLVKLHQQGLSARQLSELLFAQTYGCELIKPSLQETVAWLALDDQAVASSAIDRDPFLLIRAGDPGSLPTSVRVRLVDLVAARMISRDDEVPILDFDSLKRFARPDLAEVVRARLGAHKDNPRIRDLMLRIIWLGRIEACTDLVTDIAFGGYEDAHTQICATRALAAIGDDASKRRYADWVRTNCTKLQPRVVWETIDDFFPQSLGIEALLEILGSIDVTDRDGSLGLEWRGEEWVQRLTRQSDLAKLLEGLLHQLGGRAGSLGHPIDARENAYTPAITMAAVALLATYPDDQAPDIAIDAALRLAESNAYSRRRDSRIRIGPELRKSAARRRAALWRATQTLNNHPQLKGRAIEHLWEMDILGWRAGLQLTDIDWLLADAPLRTAANEQRLAINAALSVWREAGSNPTMRARIEEVASASPAMAAAVADYFRPRGPSAEELESSRQLEEIQRAQALKSAEQEKSWVDFVADLRADPTKFKQLRPTTSESMDHRLFYVYELLLAANHGSSSYAIDNLAPLEPILGPELSALVRRAFIDNWRNWEPRPKHRRAPNAKNQISKFDCIGIVGVTLEAKSNPHWAQQLNSSQARRAAIYATLEINGFPPWLEGLAQVWPTEVTDTIMDEVIGELKETAPGAHLTTLQDIFRTTPFIRALLAPRLLSELEKGPAISPSALSLLLGIITQNLRGPSAAAALFQERFRLASDIEVASIYMGAAFALDPEPALKALTSKLAELDSPTQTELAQRVLPKLFGDQFAGRNTDPAKLPFGSLQYLVRLAYRTIRPQDDQVHTEVFTPNVRDRAEGARGAAFNQLVETPGRATFDTLLAMSEEPDFPIPRTRMRALAIGRAAADSESEPWSPSETYQFEMTKQAAPRTAKDLQSLALSRIADIAHDLVHGDFNQGKVVSALPDEEAVQNWVADRLRVMQGRSYSVEREPHVAEEKEPDVRLRARATDASVPIEIKVANSWSVTELETALRNQLCGQYLRAREVRHGILLIVLQKKRARGWQSTDASGYLTFEQVISRLKTLAAEIAGQSADCAQPEIAVIDVSTCSAELDKEPAS
jgi:hypothetical protein